MYAIYGNIYHQYTPNVSIYPIHGSYGIYIYIICQISGGKLVYTGSGVSRIIQIYGLKSLELRDWTYDFTVRIWDFALHIWDVTIEIIESRETIVTKGNGHSTKVMQHVLVCIYILKFQHQQMVHLAVVEGMVVNGCQVRWKYWRLWVTKDERS